MDLHVLESNRPEFAVTYTWVLHVGSTDIASLLSKPVNPLTLTKGRSPRFAQKVITTEGLKGNDQDPFAVDVLTVPNKDQNPWNSWMQLVDLIFLQITQIGLPSVHGWEMFGWWTE